MLFLTKQFSEILAAYGKAKTFNGTRERLAEKMGDFFDERLGNNVDGNPKYEMKQILETSMNSDLNLPIEFVRSIQSANKE